ncbi:MAG: serine/threonine protein phosphatase [Ruminococcus sp.]|nr:serine/threonine protein phosphatase [Ruminococcus sp.]
MKLSRKKPAAEPIETGVTAAGRAEHFEYKLAPFDTFCDSSLYEGLRASVPIVDACIAKIIRLTNGFTVKAPEERFQPLLDDFCKNVTVGISGRSLAAFADMYLDSLLTYGRAFGRIFTDHKDMTVRGLYVCDPTAYKVCAGKDPVDKRVFYISGGKEIPVTSPEQLLYTTLNPSPKHPEGVSVLRGLPALSKILMRIYECIGQNFDRVGNVRYAVTYDPPNDIDPTRARERAELIAKEWTDAMSDTGSVRDFVAVGDVGIKVIGADNQIIDTQVPVRELIEQIISKLSIPPFVLGLNWSTSERMSSQQADILTSELEYYRRLLTPPLEDICAAFLRLSGCAGRPVIEWNNINLQDEESLARSRLYNAQAEQLEEQTEH